LGRIDYFEKYVEASYPNLTVDTYKGGGYPGFGIHPGIDIRTLHDIVVNKQLPVIVNVPGHFIVVTGFEGWDEETGTYSHILINDPYPSFAEEHGGKYTQQEFEQKWQQNIAVVVRPKDDWESERFSIHSPVGGRALHYLTICRVSVVWGVASMCQLEKHWMEFIAWDTGYEWLKRSINE